MRRFIRFIQQRLTPLANRCPLCDTDLIEQFTDGLLLCLGCAELLHPDELVTRATRTSRITYCRINFGTEAYPA